MVKNIGSIIIMYIPTQTHHCELLHVIAAYNHLHSHTLFVFQYAIRACITGNDHVYTFIFQNT